MRLQPGNRQGQELLAAIERHVASGRDKFYLYNKKKKKKIYPLFFPPTEGAIGMAIAGGVVAGAVLVGMALSKLRW